MIDIYETLKAKKRVPTDETYSFLLGKNINSAKIYGWHVDPSVSDSAQAVTYLADAVGKTPAAMGSSAFSYGDWEDAFFMPKPCMLRYDGTVAYYLNPNDYSKKLDGTPSDISDPDFAGNVMMEWGLIWFKFMPGEANGEGYFYVSNRKIDDTYHAWCNYDESGNIIPHFYTSAYFAAGTDKFRSLSGVALSVANGSGGTTAQQEISRAAMNNTSDAAEWYTSVYCDRLLINALLVLISKTLDTQGAFGRGFVDYSVSEGYSAKENFVTGVYDDKGLFWGDTSTGKNAVKVFGIENWWGLMWNRTAGLIENSSGHYLTKLTYSTADGTSGAGYNMTGAGYTDSGASMNIPSGTQSWGRCITKCRFTERGFFPIEFVIKNSQIHQNIGYDGQYFKAPDGNTGYSQFGFPDDGVGNCGALTLSTAGPSDESSWSCSTMLSCKPRRS